jgi:hypothetical protein
VIGVGLRLQVASTNEEGAAMNQLAAKMLETMRKLKLEEDGVTVEGRDLLAEATRDRYDPTGRYGRAPPVDGAAVSTPGPMVLRIEVDRDGKMWANERKLGPFNTQEELDLAVYGERKQWIV